MWGDSWSTSRLQGSVFKATNVSMSRQIASLLPTVTKSKINIRLQVMIEKRLFQDLNTYNTTDSHVVLLQNQHLG